MATTRNPGNRKKETAGRYGTDIANATGALTDFTATTTVTQAIGTPYPPSTAAGYSVERVSITIHTAGSDADGTLLMKLQKVRGGSGGTTIDLTDTISLEAGTITTTPTTFDVPLLSTLTPQQFVVIPGDALIWSKVNNSAAIDTQPVGAFNIEFAVGG